MDIRPLFWILLLGMIQLSVMHPLPHGNRTSALSIPTRRVAQFRNALEREVIKLLIRSKYNPGSSLPWYYKWRPLLGWRSPCKTFIAFGIIIILLTKWIEINSCNSVVELINSWVLGNFDLILEGLIFSASDFETVLFSTTLCPIFL